jgi:hypothetical protein
MVKLFLIQKHKQFDPKTTPFNDSDFAAAGD